MISDTLSDAIATIREYQRDVPECYDGIAAKINAVVDAMDTLRKELDTPPSTTTPRKPAKYPGYQTMTGAERRNARMHKMFDDAYARAQAEGRSSPWETPKVSNRHGRCEDAPCCGCCS